MAVPWSRSIFSPNPNWWWCHPLKVRWPLRSPAQDLHHQRPWHTTCTRICPGGVITTHQLLAFPRKTINSYNAHVFLPLPSPEEVVVPHNLHTSLCCDECDYQKGLVLRLVGLWRGVSLFSLWKWNYCKKNVYDYYGNMMYNNIIESWWQYTFTVKDILKEWNYLHLSFMSHRNQKILY